MLFRLKPIPAPQQHCLGATMQCDILAGSYDLIVGMMFSEFIEAYKFGACGKTTRVLQITLKVITTGTGCNR